MKKILIVFLTALFLFNCTGAGLIWISRIESHRAEIRSEINQFPHITLRFDAHDNAGFFRAGNEFESGGKRYDIVAVNQQGNDLFVYCFEDSSEKRLLSEMENNSDEETNKDKPKKNSQKKSGPDYLTTQIAPLHFTVIILDSLTAPLAFSSSAPRNIPAPPPWFV